jgi:hypothetical protein
MSAGFEQYVIAYLDILGFKKFVMDAETDSEKFDKLRNLFDKIIPRLVSENETNKSIPEKINLKCLSCSDGIVISAPVDHQYSANYPSFIAVSIKSIQISHAILDMGMLVRGAIAVGGLYRTDSNIVGTGYQEAVKGEKDAIYPQIILTKSAEDCLNNFVENGGDKVKFFAKNELEKVILNSIFPHPTYWRDTNGEDLVSNPEIRQRENKLRYQEYRETILGNMSHPDPKARAKWIWFAKLFDSNVKNSPDLSESCICYLKDDTPRITLDFLNSQHKYTFGKSRSLFRCLINMILRR